MSRAFLSIVCGLFCGTFIACGSSSSGSGAGGGAGAGGSAATGGNPGAGTGGASGTSATGGSAGSVGTGGGASGSTGAGGCASGGVPGANNSATCQALNDCEMTKCGTQIAQCFGSGYASGNFSGGQCQALATCIGNCSCNSSCVVGCSSSLDTTCQGCLQAVDTCVLSMCATEAQSCNGTGRDAGTGFPSLDAGFGFDGFTGGGGGTCTDLRACCAMLSAQAQTQCNTAANMGNDTICGAALAGFRMAGLCQ